LNFWSSTRPDIERICKTLPFTRQTLFFSATMPPEIQRLTAQFLHNPVQVETAAVSSAASTISQFAVKVSADPKAKREALRKLIRTQSNINNAIIFANRKTTVALLEKSLKQHGFNAGALHGDMDQSSRLKMLTAFRAQEVTFLIASDVAARGLDIPEVSHVFNFDVPIHSEDYVHRIGRTGRAGREGAAYMMVSSADTKHFKAIEELLKKEIEWFKLDGAETVEAVVEDATKPEKRERKPREPRTPRAPRTPKVVAEVVVEAVVAVAPKPEREARPPRVDARPPRYKQDDAEDHGGFNASNMPAFLARPAR
jgi:superfamily II DNA/RNA helicase